jgi:hypothetical protein
VPGSSPPPASANPLSLLVTGVKTPDAAVFEALLDDLQAPDPSRWAALCLRQAGLRAAELQPATLHRRRARTVTLTEAHLVGGGAHGRWWAAC